MVPLNRKRVHRTDRCMLSRLRQAPWENSRARLGFLYHQVFWIWHHHCHGIYSCKSHSEYNRSVCLSCGWEEPMTWPKRSIHKSSSPLDTADDNTAFGSRSRGSNRPMPHGSDHRIPLGGRNCPDDCVCLVFHRADRHALFGIRPWSQRFWSSALSWRHRARAREEELGGSSYPRGRPPGSLQKPWHGPRYIVTRRIHSTVDGHFHSRIRCDFSLHLYRAHPGRGRTGVQDIVHRLGLSPNIWRLGTRFSAGNGAVAQVQAMDTLYSRLVVRPFNSDRHCDRTGRPYDLCAGFADGLVGEWRLRFHQCRNSALYRLGRADGARIHVQPRDAETEDEGSSGCLCNDESGSRSVICDTGIWASYRENKSWLEPALMALLGKWA